MTVVSQEELEVSFANGPAVDSFNRQRVSQVKSELDLKLTHDKQSMFFDEVTAGSATSIHSVANAEVVLAVTADPADYAIRQTRMRVNYQSGKGQQIILTGSINPESGVTKRIGYFNSNTSAPYDSDKDGLWFESTGSGVSVNQSKTGTVTSVPQAEWNSDRLNGNGSSGVLADWSKPQIFWMDFAWLGLGAVRFGVKINEELILCHVFWNANINDSVYMSSPNHSVRYEIRRTGGAGSMQEICSMVGSEGGQDLTGPLRGADRGVTSFSTGNGGANSDLFPLLSIRLKNGYEDSIIKLNSIGVLVTSNVNFRWGVYLNPGIDTPDNAVWTAVRDSPVEYDISRDNTNLLDLSSDGWLIDSGYMGASIETIDTNVYSEVTLGMGIDGTKDELILAVQQTNTSNETFYASMNWVEL